MKPKMRYLTNCVGLSNPDPNIEADNVDDLNAMIEAGEEVKYPTFARNVALDDLRAAFPSYTWGPGNDGGLRLKNDWAVHYFRSTFRGEPCYYMDHSRIEYIFTDQGGGLTDD